MTRRNLFRWLGLAGLGAVAAKHLPKPAAPALAPVVPAPPPSVPLTQPVWVYPYWQYASATANITYPLPYTTNDSWSFVNSGGTATPNTITVYELSAVA